MSGDVVLDHHDNNAAVTFKIILIVHLNDLKLKFGKMFAILLYPPKADEYSSKRTWSSISEQYPEGLTRGVNQYTRQKFRNQTTRQHEKTRLTKIRNGN